MMAKQNVSNLGLVAILSIGFVAMAFTATTPAMAALMAAFPDAGQNISLLSNGHIFTLVPVTLLSGWLTNNGKMKYKVATLVGSALMLIGGVGPALIHTDFTVMIIWKLIFGIGLGLLTPLAQSLVLNLYEGDKQARYLGWITLLMNAGGIVAQMLGGIIVDSTVDGWFMHYWVYAMCVVPLILSFFIPEPEIVPAPVGGSAEKASMGSFVWIAGIFLFLVNLFNFPIMMYMTAIFIERGIGGEAAATTAATALSLFTVAGVVAGFVYGWVFKMLKRFTLPLGFLLMAVGAGLIYIAGDVIVITLGCICLGFSFSIVMPSFMSLLGMKTSPSKIAIATSVCLAIMNLGALAVTPYLQILEGITGPGLPLYNMAIMLSALYYIVAAIILFAWNPYKNLMAPPAPAPDAAPEAE